MYGLKLATGPTAEPISLAEAKLHLRISTDASPSTDPEDSLISTLITAARLACEQHKEEGFITQTWDLFLDKFPTYKRTLHRHNYRCIEIPKGPLQYIESVTYKDLSGTNVVTLLDPSGTALFETDDYLVDRYRRFARLCLRDGCSWPETVSEANAVSIRFVVGYGEASDVPEEIKAAIKLTLGWLYENRGDVDPDKIPGSAQMLLGPKTVLA